MQLRTFILPSRGDQQGEDELNRFLRSHRILQVERHFRPVRLKNYAANANLGSIPMSMSRLSLFIPDTVTAANAWLPSADQAIPFPFCLCATIMSLNFPTLFNDHRLHRCRLITYYSRFAAILKGFHRLFPANM